MAIWRQIREGGNSGVERNNAVLLIQSQQIYFPMTSIQLRSKSAQERKQETTRRELQSKLDWILNQKCPSMEWRGRQKGVPREDQNHKQALGKLHPAIQKVQSIQNMQLVGMKSAIHELQDLANPTQQQEIPPEYKRYHQRRQQPPESFKLQYDPHAERKDLHFRNKIEKQQNQTVQYYKEENAKLKTQLGHQRTKNQEFIAVIKKLEHANCQLQKEVNLLLQKWQKEHANARNINELQHDYKQQLIINLQLEQLLLKQKLQTEKKQPPEQIKSQENYKAVIKELNHQLSEHKNIADKETHTLKALIGQKEKEINQLKQFINKYNETKPQETPNSLHQLQSPSSKLQCNFMERFVNFSKEMQAKLSQNYIVSTHPSLQDTAMDLQANRKHSQSEYSKGNCPSVEIPLLEVKGMQQPKGSSKTSRT